MVLGRCLDGFFIRSLTWMDMIYNWYSSTDNGLFQIWNSNEQRSITIVSLHCNLGGILRFETNPYPFFICEIAIFLYIDFQVCTVIDMIKKNIYSHVFHYNYISICSPRNSQMVDNPVNWGHYVDKKCPFTGPQPQLMVGCGFPSMGIPQMVGL